MAAPASQASSPAVYTHSHVYSSYKHPIMSPRESGYAYSVPRYNAGAAGRSCSGFHSRYGYRSEPPSLSRALGRTSAFLVYSPAVGVPSCGGRTMVLLDDHRDCVDETPTMVQKFSSLPKAHSSSEVGCQPQGGVEKLWLRPVPTDFVSVIKELDAMRARHLQGVRPRLRRKLRRERLPPVLKVRTCATELPPL